MKKKILFLSMIVFVAVVVAIFGNGEKETSSGGKPVVKIGAILPLTGDLAHLGQSVKKGIEFAIGDVNRIPGNKFAYEAVFEDAQQMVSKAVPAAEKLIAVDKVSALMTIYSGFAKATAPMIVRNRIIGLHGTYTDSILDGVYNFENLSTNAEINRGVIDFANSRRFGKIAFAIQQTPASLEMAAELGKKLKGEIRDFDLEPGERDFKMLVYKIKEWNPDLVFVSADVPVLDIFVRELQRQQVGGAKLGLDLINRTENYPSFEGFYILNTSNGSPEFIERFGSPATYYAPYFYDGIMFFRNAVEKAAGGSGKIPAAEAVSAEIHKLKSYEGVVGRYKILPNGKFETPMILYKIEGGKAEIVE